MPHALHSSNPNSTGKRLCRLGYAASEAKSGRSLQSFGAKSPFSGELLVVQLNEGCVAVWVRNQIFNIWGKIWVEVMVFFGQESNMPTVQVEAQLTTDELLRAVQQLDKTELEKFVFQVVNLRAKQQAPSLPKNEAELLQKINQGLPKELLKKYNELVSKRQAEDLSPDEYNELLKLTDQVEKLEAHRVEYLAEMARLRQASMTDLMNSLGIQSPAYV